MDTGPGQGTHEVAEVDVVVIGAGFAGLYQLHRLRGAGFSVRVLEAASGVGGTWYWNRYPGARCDVESLEYSYSFDEDLQQEWEWSERYAGQPEILRYLEHVADRFDLRPHISFDTRVTAASFAEATDRWRVRCDTGLELSARFVVAATGCLSSTNRPDLPGLASFAGTVLHTGEWPRDGVDLRGLRVGVIGTGSSAIQAIPVIAEQAAPLVVFQRTATYSVPARNRPLDAADVARVKASYAALRAANRRTSAGFGGWTTPATTTARDADDAERRRVYAERWERGGFGFLGGYTDLLVDAGSNDTAAEFVRQRIREIVEDPEVADLLAPRQVIGCKRLCLDSGYFETFNRPHVHLVDISGSGIEAVTPTGVRAGGADHELDVLVLATGFDAMTGTLLRLDLTGRDGRTLREEWAAGPRTYLGLGVPGLPNLFLVTGPGSPSVLTNMVTSIEHHVEWITGCLEHLRDQGCTRIEAADRAADEWVAHVNAVASTTLFPTCNSWYLGANVPGKPRVFMPLPGFATYADRCAEVAAAGYEGFELGSPVSA